MTTGSLTVLFEDPFWIGLFEMIDQWLPAHPEYKWAPNSCCMEWYQGTDIQSPDYQCGVMMPLE